MRKLIWLIAALSTLALGASCRTTGAALNPHTPAGNGATAAGEAGDIRLALSAQPEGGDYRLILAAPNAADLYQVGGTLVYDPQRYSIVRVEAGGGLGDPQTSYFFDGEQAPGRHGFAYTKRYAEAGASGPVSLLHFIVHPLGSRFNLDDFTLATRELPLKARDSKKHDFRVTLTRGAVQR